MECLSPDQIRDRSERCVMEVESLLAAKALVGKPRARQWRFFRDAVEHPLLGNHSSEFEGISRVQAAQLKFEVEDKLRRFYLRPGHPPQFVFTLVHQSELGLYGVGEGDAYPPLAGYCVLVRDLSEDHVGEGQITGDDLSLYLGKVVTACVDAEFAAYAALPEIRLEEVRRWFCADGPAYREIANLVSRHQERGWVISNPMNPSTKRLLGTKVKRAAGPEAIVGTTEYWYLRWWGTRERTYVYPYRETNRQVYVLRKESDGWRVSQNLRPPPRSSVGSRWRQKREKPKAPGIRCLRTQL